MTDLRESVEALSGPIHGDVGDAPIPEQVHKEAEKREQKLRAAAHAKAISLPALVLLLLLEMSLAAKGRATLIAHREVFEAIVSIAVVWLAGSVAVVEYLVRRRRARKAYGSKARRCVP